MFKVLSIPTSSSWKLLPSTCFHQMVFLMAREGGRGSRDEACSTQGLCSMSPCAVSGGAVGSQACLAWDIIPIIEGLALGWAPKVLTFPEDSCQHQTFPAAHILACYCYWMGFLLACLHRRRKWLSLRAFRRGSGDRILGIPETLSWENKRFIKAMCLWLPHFAALVGSGLTDRLWGLLLPEKWGVAIATWAWEQERRGRDIFSR